MEQLQSFLAGAVDWPLWAYFRLESSKWPNSGNIFGLAEYIAALALLLVVMVASDFRFRYRLSVTKRDLRKWGFWSALAIGTILLAIDVWYQNSLPVPLFMANANNLKAFLGLSFILLVFRVLYVGVIRRPAFSRNNAEQFFTATYHFIHEGNADRLQVIAEDLCHTLNSIVALAAKLPNQRDEEIDEYSPPSQIYAHQFLLLIGDERFCKIVVDKVPAFAFVCIEECQKYPNGNLPIFQFARNIGQEFIRNTSSSFYQEDSGYYSGLVGYARPASRIVFGSYQFVEKCATDGGSPLEADYRDFLEIDPRQMEGFSRAALSFFGDYLKATKGRSHPHSYALTRMLHAFENSLSDLHGIDGLKDYSNTDAYKRLRTAVHFVDEAINLIDAHAVIPKSYRSSKNMHGDIFDKFSSLIFDIIFSASVVSTPPWTAWSVQHNAVWSKLFTHDKSQARKIIALKVRRLLYSEILRMDEFANFKGARILGYCLNVLGLTRGSRYKSYSKEFYPLRAAAITWTKANYHRLLADHPKVAEACIQGSVTYDAEKHRLVKTYSNETRKEPNREYLDLDTPGAARDRAVS